jgi:hypothetical protein
MSRRSRAQRDREDAQDDRDQARDDGTEDDHEHDQGGDDPDALADPDVLLGDGLEVLVARGLTEQEGLEPVGLTPVVADDGSELVEVVDGVVAAARDLDLDQRGPSVIRHGRGLIERRPDLGDDVGPKRLEALRALDDPWNSVPPCASRADDERLRRLIGELEALVDERLGAGRLRLVGEGEVRRQRAPEQGARQHTTRHQDDEPDGDHAPRVVAARLRDRLGIELHVPLASFRTRTGLYLRHTLTV